MSNQPKIYKYKDLSGLAARLRGDLVEHDFVLLTLIMEQVKPVYL